MKPFSCFIRFDLSLTQTLSTMPLRSYHSLLSAQLNILRTNFANSAPLNLLNSKLLDKSVNFNYRKIEIDSLKMIPGNGHLIRPAKLLSKKRAVNSLLPLPLEPMESLGIFFRSYVSSSSFSPPHFPILCSIIRTKTCRITFVVQKLPAHCHCRLGVKLCRPVLRISTWLIRCPRYRLYLEEKLKLW